MSHNLVDMIEKLASQQPIEERERLQVYEMWPELPAKVQQWILRRVIRYCGIQAGSAKGLEDSGEFNHQSNFPGMSPSTSGETTETTEKTNER